MTPIEILENYEFVCLIKKSTVNIHMDGQYIHCEIVRGIGLLESEKITRKFNKPESAFKWLETQLKEIEQHG